MTQPDPVRLDRLVAPVLVEIRECLCAELDSTEFGPVCECCIRHSEVRVPMDACDCDCGGGTGQAWVRLVSLVADLGGLPVSAAGPCGGVRWIATIEVGVYRCTPTHQPDGTPVSCEQRESDALKLLGDAAALRRVANCCEAAEYREQANLQPVGPSGHCAGYILQFQLPLTGR